jgi:hypothetical protein
MKQQLQEQLQELLDIKACEEVIMRYGRTLDWLDEAGQESCFWPDAEIDYGFFQGAGADWVPTVMAVEATAPGRWHVTTAVMVQIQGYTAKSESYGMSVSSSKDAQGELVDTMFGGRYLDELEKRDGQWRISKRSYMADWAQQFPDKLQSIASQGFILNSVQISTPGHELYPRL